MSLLIKGMEMPKQGRVTLQIGADGAVYVVDKCEITAEKYEENFEAVEVPEWIPVTERLPDSDTEYVLCCGSKGGMFVGWAAIKSYDGSGKCMGFQNSGKGRNFTHWTSLPEPPEVKS